MTPIERKIFRLEDDIRIGKMHLEHMQKTPYSFSHPSHRKSANQLSKDIKLQQIRITKKVTELENLKKQL